MPGRAASTISRELWRNRSVHDGFYRVDKAQGKAMARRSKSRKKSQFRAAELARILVELKRYWSPQQIAGRQRLLRRAGTSATRPSTGR